MSESILQSRGGPGTRITASTAGRVFTSRRRLDWRHPWFTQAVWSPDAQRWTAAVAPGFVGAQTPVWRTTTETQREVEPNFGINPFTGKPYFSEYIFKNPTEPAERAVIDIPLYLGPALELPWRAVGWDGGDEDPVPPFFLDRGAARRPAQPEPGSDEPAHQEQPPEDLRLLRVCDVWVRQPRLGLTSQITQEPGLLTGISNVTQTLGVRTPVDATLRILTGKLPAPVTPEPLADDYEEQTWDDLLVSTVFLLSPAGTAPGSDPDGSWAPFVRHNLFWNVNYEPGVFRPLAGDPEVPFIPPLAAGAAQLVINFLTASLNDMSQQALNILLGYSLAGTFWTPTGGGHDAAFPPDPPKPPQGRTGLDKAGRIDAARAAAAAARQAEQLDPPFPYRALPFDLALLSA